MLSYLAGAISVVFLERKAIGAPFRRSARWLDLALNGKLDAVSPTANRAAQLESRRDRDGLPIIAPRKGVVHIDTITYSAFDSAGI